MAKSGKKTALLPVDRGRGRWLVARFAPASLFSLRMTHATSKGGKTLLVPTPYAVKMTLLNACFRRWTGSRSEEKAREVLQLIKGREIRFRPPREAVVQHTFVKVLDLAREASKEGASPFRSTTAYREFVAFQGDLEIAVAATGLDSQGEQDLSELFLCCDTFGKRGSFFQFLSMRIPEGGLPTGFTAERSSLQPHEIADYRASQALDDFGDDLCRAPDAFERVSTYCDKKIVLNKHRILRLTAIPYERISAGRRFTWYRRCGRDEE